MSRIYLALKHYQETDARRMYATGKYTVSEMAQLYGCRLIDMCNTLKDDQEDVVDHREGDMGTPFCTDDEIVAKYNQFGSEKEPSFKEKVKALPSKSVSLFKQLNTISR